MMSEQTIDPNISIKCRICWEEDGKRISPCYCAGSMGYVHENCLKTWIQKSLQKGDKQSIQKENGYFAIVCELCKGQITFKMDNGSKCLNVQSVKENINQNKGFFFVLIFIILGIATIAIVMLREVIKELVGGRSNIWGTVFIFCFVGILFALEIRFIFSLINSFFRSNKYQIKKFRLMH